MRLARLCPCRSGFPCYRGGAHHAPRALARTCATAAAAGRRRARPQVRMWTMHVPCAEAAMHRPPQPACGRGRRARAGLCGGPGGGALARRWIPAAAPGPGPSLMGCHTEASAGRRRKPPRYATPGRGAASAERPHVPLRHPSPEPHRRKLPALTKQLCIGITPLSLATLTHHSICHTCWNCCQPFCQESMNVRMSA